MKPRVKNPSITLQAFGRLSRWLIVLAIVTLASQLAFGDDQWLGMISGIYCQLGDGLCYQAHLLGEPETTIEMMLVDLEFLLIKTWDFRS